MSKFKIDSKGSGDCKIMKEVTKKNIVVGDIITKKNFIEWDDLTDDEGNKISSFKGTIQHHLISRDEWITIMDLENTRYKGKSTKIGNDFVLTVEEIE